MERIEFNLLKAQMEAQGKEIDRIYKNLEDRERGAKRSKARLESLGYQLHNLYCAFEDLFKIVARHFENQVENIPRLLRLVSLSIEGVRPPLLAEETYRQMDELRAFRHFFRHAYGYELRYEKIKVALESAKRLKDCYQRDLARFLEAVEKELEPA